MDRHDRKSLTAIAALLVVALLISGCGRRGNLEAPPGASVVVTDEQGNPVTKPAPKPDKPFILDGLI